MNDMLERLIALFGIYGTAAAVLSALFEVAAQVSFARARWLKHRLDWLLGPDLANRVLHNPLIQKSGGERDRQELMNAKSLRRSFNRAGNYVSYIEPRDFALALMREGLTAPEGPAGPLDPQCCVPPNTRVLLETLLQGTQGVPPHVQERIESWFRKDQQQLTALYGASTRNWGIAFGIAFSLWVNLDTFALLTTGIESKGVLAALHDVLPQPMRSLAGCTVSGIMIAQGSTFWFDLVARITNLRSEGHKPGSPTA